MAIRILEFIGIDLDAAINNIDRYVAFVRQTVAAEAGAQASYIGKRFGLLAAAGALAIAVLVAAIATLVTWLTPQLGLAGAWGVAAVVLLILDGAVLAGALAVRQSPVVVPPRPPMATVVKGMNFGPVAGLAKPFVIPAAGAALAAASAYFDSRRRKPATVSEALAPSAERLSETVSEGISQVSATAAQFTRTIQHGSRPAIFGTMGAATLLGWIIARRLTSDRHLG